MAEQALDIRAVQDAMLKKRLYVIWSEVIEGAGDRMAVVEDHFRYMMAMEERGAIFAAGPVVDEATGDPAGPALIVVRAASSADAAAIADQDPYHARGFRSYRILPWQVNEGSFDLRVNFSNGTYSFA